MHRLCSKSKAQIRNVQRCKVVHVFTVQHGFQWLLAKLFVACLANQKKVQWQPAEWDISLPTIVEKDDKSILPLCWYTGTTTVVQLTGLIKL